MAFVYILECSDKTLYTGWTVDLIKRVELHNNKKGAKYTKARVPVKLVYYEEYEEKIMAQKREFAIKKLTRNQKLNLIQGFLQKDFKV